MSAKDKGRLKLLNDYGYDWQGNTIIERGIRGFTSDRIWGRARDLFDAIERLCPIIRKDDYTTRMIKLNQEDK